MATEHTITADLLFPGAGTHKADLTYSYTPPVAGDKPDNDYPAELELLKVSMLHDDAWVFSKAEVRAIAETWLNDEGYDLACDLAEEQRGDLK